jgi:hypothetical membrane protein
MFLQIFPLFGILGTLIIILGIGTSALYYQGKQGERFSLLNHFISELGEVEISRSASLFNLGMILGGLTLVPYMVGLGFRFDSLAGWLGSATGVIAVLAVAAVGIFPVNNLAAHVRAAMTYFRSGLIMVFFFALAILFQGASLHPIPQTANMLSVLAFLPYAAFLFLSGRRYDQNQAEALDPQMESVRPRISLLPILEWAVFFTTILWLFGMALFF